MNNIKKFTQQDRYGNMMSYELFEPQPNVPPVASIPKPEGIDFKPKGTDTVPAMLTPGENVINAEASRKYQPIIDKMNNEGRAMQQAQGGPIPTYESDGGKIPAYANVGMNTIDFIKDKEGVRNKAYKDSGGVLTIGAGSTKDVKEGQVIDDEEVNARLERDLDIAEKDYNNLVTAELNPNQKTAVTSLIFNIGGPNFAKSEARKKLNAGDHEGFLAEMKEFRMANGEVIPGLESRRLAEAELFNTEYEDPIIKAANKTIIYDDGSNREPDFLEKIGLVSSAEASTDDNVPEVDTGGITDTIRRIPGQIYDGVKSIGNQYIDQMKKTDILDDIVSARNDLENHNQDIAYLEQQISNASPNSKPSLIKKLEELKKEGPKLESKLKELGKQYKEIPNYDGVSNYKPEGFELFPGEGLETGSVDEAIDKSIPPTIKEVPEDTTGTIPKVSNVYDQPIGPPEATLLDKGMQLGEDTLNIIGEWFKDTASGMFSGELLGKAVVSYAGSRALGYNHQDSFNHSLKTYGKDIEAQRVAANKYVLSKDATTKFTTKSLEKFKKTRDMTDLVPKKSSSIIGGGTGSRLWLQGYGAVEKVKIGEDQYVIRLDDGRQLALDDPRIAGLWHTYDDDQMDPMKLEVKYAKDFESMQKSMNANPKDEDTKEMAVNIPKLSSEATNLLLNDYKLYGAKPKDMQNFKTAMSQAQEMYLKRMRAHLDNDNIDPPLGLAEFYQQTKIKMRTSTPGKSDGVSFNMVNKTTNENYMGLDKKILNAIIQENPNADKNTQAQMYREDWQQLNESWARATSAQRKLWEKGAKDVGGWNGFTWWANAWLMQDEGALKLTQGK